jgi:FkbM family methyltransferase
MSPAPSTSEIVSASVPDLRRRMQDFLAKPGRGRYLALARRLRRVWPEMPIPLRLPFGAWWLAEASALDHELMLDGFEGPETHFVSRVLRPGMTVLDIGAHHGLYTLLASKRVGNAGRVIAFEPSGRERKRLKRHLRVNGCANVSVEEVALGDCSGEVNLFVVEGRDDWCNSLRAPAVTGRTQIVRVEVRTLDEVLETLRVSSVDFIKLDVEGAELSLLRGACQLLRSEWRPAILAEVQDIRTEPWGYAAREIVGYLKNANYRWFGVTADGALRRVSTEQRWYDANLVALPEERSACFEKLFAEEEVSERMVPISRGREPGERHQVLG